MTFWPCYRNCAFTLTDLGCSPECCLLISQMPSTQDSPTFLSRTCWWWRLTWQWSLESTALSHLCDQRWGSMHRQAVQIFQHSDWQQAGVNSQHGSMPTSKQASKCTSCRSWRTLGSTASYSASSISQWFRAPFCTARFVTTATPGQLTQKDWTTVQLPTGKSDMISSHLLTSVNW